MCTSASRAHLLFCLSFRVWRMLLFVVFNDFIDDVLDSEDVSDQRRGPLPLCKILFLKSVLHVNKMRLLRSLLWGL